MSINKNTTSYRERCRPSLLNLHEIGTIIVIEPHNNVSTPDTVIHINYYNNIVNKK